MTGQNTYSDVLGCKLKKAGRDFVKGLEMTERRLAALENSLKEVVQDAKNTKTILPWQDAVDVLQMELPEQELLCILWAEQAPGQGMELPEFRRVLRELSQEKPDDFQMLPSWIQPYGDRIRISPVLYGWLEGQLPELPEGAELFLPVPETSYGIDSLLEEGKEIFGQAGEAGEPQILCISGEPGSGRQFYMEQLCALEDIALLLLNDRYYQDTERNMNECILCVRLYGAFPCIRIGKENQERLLKRMSAWFRFFGIIKDDTRMLDEDVGAVVRCRRIPKPDQACRLLIAENILGGQTGELPPGVRMKQLVGRQLPIGSFLRYMKNVRAELAGGKRGVEHALLSAGSSSLHLLPSDRTFEELKLPEAQYGQLRKISRMIAAREQVMTQWGFADKFSYGNGMSVLFYGAPGTGKTMAAQVLANELGMPLYRVDLSQLISKYIGETQKNISRIFDEAEKHDCILLFDEADAVFAKRSDVSDAQDRYSNAETAYLLQRIEQYAGVSILATNLLQNFDEAFRRRISYMVHFPMPDTELRRQLWESIFPEHTPVSDDVDCQILAQAFELSGASVKNAALHGALLAGSEGCRVGMKHILDGIYNEYSKQGRSISSSQKELMEAFQQTEIQDDGGGCI